MIVKKKKETFHLCLVAARSNCYSQSFLPERNHFSQRWQEWRTHENNYWISPLSPLLRVIINHAAGQMPGEWPGHQTVNCTGTG